MKRSAMIPVVLALFSLPTWGDTAFTQSNSRDYVVSGRVVEDACTLSLSGDRLTTSAYGWIQLKLGTVGFGFTQLSDSYGPFTNTVPPMGEMLTTADLRLTVLCSASMTGTMITVTITTTDTVDAETKAVTNHYGNGTQGDFGIKLYNKDDKQDIDFTTATASSVELTSSTEEGNSAQAEINYQVGMVRYGARIMNTTINAHIVFNVDYE